MQKSCGTQHHFQGVVIRDPELGESYFGESHSPPFPVNGGLSEVLMSTQHMIATTKLNYREQKKTFFV